MKLLIIFSLLTVINVTLQTIKSIATIKCGKSIAALINAIAYGLYTFVVFYTASDGISLWAKAGITAGANLVGVYIVKFFEEKATKEKLWKVEAAISKVSYEHNIELLTACTVSHNFIDVGTHYIVNFFCTTKDESHEVKILLKHTDAKYFVSESKTL